MQYIAGHLVPFVKKCVMKLTRFINSPLFLSNNSLGFQLAAIESA